MRVKFLTVIFIFIGLPVFSQTFDDDIRWNVVDSPLVFPSNFKDWIFRNLQVPERNIAGRPFGEIILADQVFQFVDFNGDSKKDILIRLSFDSYMSDSLRQARQTFYKGIFIAQTNGKYLLDTNYIISNRGYVNGGDFGDFNGDGKLDYITIMGNFHGRQEDKPLDLYRYGNDLSPSVVFFNNGKGFTPALLDTTYLGSSWVVITDINNDQKDEIITAVDEKYAIYSFNESKGSFELKFLQVGAEINRRYGRVINFIITPKLSNSNILAVVSYNNCFTPPCANYNTADLAVLKIDLLNDKCEVIDSMKQAHYVWPDGQISTQGLYSGPHFKYTDLDNNQKLEFIILGGLSRFINGSSQFYGERMGINIYSESKLVTNTFYERDTLDHMTKGFFGNIGGDISVFPNDGLHRSVKVDSSTREKSKYIYYRFLDGKFRKRQMKFNRKNLALSSISMDYLNFVEDYNADQKTDVLLVDNYDVRNAKLFLQVNCKEVIKKPSFNTSSFSICSGDSLRLSITNVNKGDSLKWYFGSNSDLNNVSSKSFGENTKLYVTRIDSFGCNATSDTIQISVLNRPNKPIISWNGSELSIPNTYTSYQWLQNNIVIANATLAQFKPTTTGQFRVIVTNASGCSDTSDVYNLIVTAVTNTGFAQNSITIFPNPANDFIIVDLGGDPAKAAGVQLLDNSGRVLTSWIQSQRQKQIDLSKFAKGSYLIQINSGKQKVVKKFIK